MRMLSVSYLLEDCSSLVGNGAGEGASLKITWASRDGPVEFEMDGVAFGQAAITQCGRGKWCNRNKKCLKSPFTWAYTHSMSIQIVVQLLS